MAGEGGAGCSPEAGRAAAGGVPAPPVAGRRGGDEARARSKPWGPLAAVLLLAFAVIGILAYGFRTDPRAVPSPPVGARAPDFTLRLFDGATVRLSDYRGNVVVLNLWASWCVPCRQEAPILEAGWRALKGRGVVVLGVNIQDTEGAARAFLREFGLSFPNGRDTGGKIAIDYGVYGLPETFFIGADGRITAKIIGPLDPARLAARTGEALQGILGAEERRPGLQRVR